ncbi:hypothetical protein BC834DRAFT_967418 [Gloeopeniophorella convolvens]|nr:hypothetical protein BC834DRAFT_967418 [Gloeopeniophorella convolvens]
MHHVPPTSSSSPRVESDSPTGRSRSAATTLGDLDLNALEPQPDLPRSYSCPHRRPHRPSHLLAPLAASHRAPAGGPACTSISPGLPSALPSSSSTETDAHAEETVCEQPARNCVFLDDAGVAPVRRASVALVVMCGGIGSWAAVQLAHAGVRHLRLVDLLRHALVT